MVVASLVYINDVTNFIPIICCVLLTCEAGSRMPHAASLFPPLSSPINQSRIADSPVRCLSCDFHSYTQRCAAAFQQSLCATAQKWSRRVYGTPVCHARAWLTFKRRAAS